MKKEADDTCNAHGGLGLTVVYSGLGAYKNVHDGTEGKAQRRFYCTAAGMQGWVGWRAGMGPPTAPASDLIGLRQMTRPQGSSGTCGS